jgi:type III secretion system FlhB-like substrate exporter
VKKAVALKYEFFNDHAPRVVAKVNDGLQNRYCHCSSNGIYIHEDPELVALLSKIDIGSEIPEILYHALQKCLLLFFS